MSKLAHTLTHTRSWVIATVAALSTLGIVAALTLGGDGEATSASAPDAPAASAAPSATNSTNAGSAAQAALSQRYLGASSAGAPWHSGAWVGGYMSGERATRWGSWRGAASDVTPTFPQWGTWEQLANSTWHIDTYANFNGTLIYGLPMLPKNAKASELADVAAGKHDATFRAVAKQLAARKRGNSIVRIGWEANGTWMSYSVTASTASNYRAAFNRIATVMRAQAPQLLFSFDINCGTPLSGQNGRLDSLTLLYPGDEAVDLIGCSAYDWYVIGATTAPQWQEALHPMNSVGLGDVADFAREHNKGMAISEWGLAARKIGGNGDNPFYIRAMYEFFTDNLDILVAESYFNEADNGQGSSLWTEKSQNPAAAAQYRSLWGVKTSAGS